MSRNFYTSEDDERIMELVNIERMVYREVADAMGRTVGSIGKRVARLRAMGYEIHPARTSTMERNTTEVSEEPTKRKWLKEFYVALLVMFLLSIILFSAK